MAVYRRFDDKTIRMITIMGFDDWTIGSSTITITDNDKNPPLIKSPGLAACGAWTDQAKF